MINKLWLSVGFYRREQVNKAFSVDLWLFSTSRNHFQPLTGFHFECEHVTAGLLAAMLFVSGSDVAAVSHIRKWFSESPAPDSRQLMCLYVLQMCPSRKDAALSDRPSRQSGVP